MIALLALALAFPRPGHLAQLARADELWAAGERAAAIERLEQTLQAEPDDRAVRARLVERELEVGRFVAALAHCEGLGPEADASRGRALYFLARYDEALERLDEREPELLPLVVESLRALGRTEEMEARIELAEAVLGADAPLTLALRARRATRLERFDEAASLYRGVLARAPLDAEARFGLGRALVRLGEREQGLAVLAEHRALVPLLDALDHAERGLALEPRHAANQAALGDAWRALVSFDPGALARAEAAYVNATQHAVGPELVPIALRHARLRAEDAADVEGALAVLLAAESRVRDARLLVRRADLLAELGRVDAALAALAEALELRPGDAAIEARRAALRARESR